MRFAPGAICLSHIPVIHPIYLLYGALWFCFEPWNEQSFWTHAFFELEVTLPGKPVVTLPFEFTRELGREEVSQLQKSIQSAPFCPAADSTIGENQQFKYVIFAPAGADRFDRAIILLHGLNERSWNKYLTWAEDLVMTCGVPVVLFPIAFHMNRTPAAWVTPRGLVPWLNRRKQEIKNFVQCIFFQPSPEFSLPVRSPPGFTAWPGICLQPDPAY